MNERHMDLDTSLKRQRSKPLCLCVLILASGIAAADEPALVPKLRLALASNREHYWYPRIVIYDHDGALRGQVVKVLTSPDKRLDHHPALAGDGQRLVYGWEAEGGVGRMQLWDLKAGAGQELGELDQAATTLFSPSLSADGKLLAFTAWSRPGASSRWDVHLWDLMAKKPIELANLNSQQFDERRVAISGDGRWLAFTTNADGGQGLSDIRLYDRETGKVDLLAELNSPASENYPALSGDGGQIAFTSDREGGSGGTDVYLFDCRARKLVELPGLNAPGQEQSPSLSASGRYLAFVSERLGSAGEQDTYLYDRTLCRLLDTPGLNTARDDFDPVVIELSATSVP
jgi:Tol biopolymer transport system component